MEQDIEKENKRLRDLLYSKIMFIEQLKKDYRNLVKDIEEIIKNYNEARDLAIELRDAHETVRKEFLRADKNKDMWREKAEKYHTTLQEIKEIAEFHITDTDSEDVQNDMKQIIDLITKAEEECEQNFINRDYDRCDKGIRQWLESED